jgi:hypothetical protein
MAVITAIAIPGTYASPEERTAVLGREVGVSIYLREEDELRGADSPSDTSRTVAF